MNIRQSNLLFYILVTLCCTLPGMAAVDFTANVTEGYAPLIVRFSDMSDDEAIYYRWDFGDDTPVDREQHPGHVYTRAGEYSVTLTITTALGQVTETKSAYIRVSERENSPVPPKWVYRPWVWEEDGNNEADIRALVQGYQDLDIPVGAVILDSPWATAYNTFEFDTTRYPDIAGMIDDFHNDSIKVIAWITPLINDRSYEDPRRGHASNYDAARDSGYFIDNGTLYPWWKGVGSFIDYTHPEGLAWWHGQMDKALDLGLDGWKTDAGNRAFPETGSGHNGTLTKKEYSKLYYMDFYEYTRQVRGEGAILFSKPYDETLSDSMYVPRAYTPTAFVGDQLHDWSDKGLLNALNNVFQSAQRNFVAVGSDIGGYMGDMEMTKNLLIRWIQFGAMCPIMENGGHGEHRPWMFDQQTVDIYRYWATLHTQLAPYFHTYGVQAGEGGPGILRPVEGVWQYTLGEELLVAAMYQDTTARDIELPAGSQWIDFWHDDVMYNGGETLVNYDCPLEQYPVFIKSGAIIPMEVNNDVTGHGSSSSVGKLTLLVYPDEFSEFTCHDESGQATRFTSQMSDEDLHLAIDPATGDYIWRVKYAARPSMITLNGSPLVAQNTFSGFESAASGWYYDPQQHYVWIKTGDQSGPVDIELTPGATAGFTANPVTGVAPLSVQFTDQSIAANTWNWDFGDGSPASVEQHPVHVYTEPGNYTVTLYVSGPDGSDTIVRQHYIKVALAGHDFTDVTASAGLDLSLASGSRGVTVTDVDHDGYYDIFVGNTGDKYYYDFLYMNQGDGTFAQQSEVRGVDSPGYTWSIKAADFDNDGSPDAFYGNHPVGSNRAFSRNKLYRNNGSGYYSDISESAGLSVFYSITMGAAIADYNGDGWLDLYVVNHGSENEFYLNDGTGSLLLKDRGVNDDNSGKQGVAAADVDNDGDTDLYLCRNGQLNRLYINDGTGHFTEEASARGVAGDMRAHNPVFADVDNDGDLDLFVTKYLLTDGELSLLGVYINRGDGTFHDQSQEYNIRASLYSILFADMDNDADLDLIAIRNNQKEPDATPELYINDGQGHFTSRAYPGLAVPADDPWGAAVVDYENDGDLDLFVTARRGSNYLLRNDLESDNHYIDVLVTGPGGDYGGLGSMVRVYEPGYLGQASHLLGMQQVSANGGYLSQNQPALHFGLNGFSTCDIQVHLSDSTILNYTNVSANQVFSASKATGTMLSAPGAFTLSAGGNNAVWLSWQPVAGAEGYHVYRGEHPGFTPGDGNRIGFTVTDQDPAVDGVQWRDTDTAPGTSGVQYYYRITAVSAGLEGPASDCMGIYDYPLLTTVTTDFNDIALPLVNPAITDAAALLGLIDSCNSVARWNATLQSYEQYIPGLEFSNFGLAAGDPVYVNVTADGIFRLTGAPVAADYHLITTPTTDFNEIMLPLDMTDIATASQLLAAIPHCNSVAYWDAPAQGYWQYIPGLDFTDFGVRPGQPYYVNVTGNVTWPGNIEKAQPNLAPQVWSGGPVYTPHLVYGDLDMKNVTRFAAYITENPDDLITSAQTGNLLTDGHWAVQIGSMPRGWRAGQTLHIDFYGDDGNILGAAECELTWNPADEAGAVRSAAVVTDYMLYQNYPNPFNPETTIRFALPQPGRVRLTITDITGRRVKTLIDHHCDAGYHRAAWTGDNAAGRQVASGVYFYTLSAGERVMRKKLVLVR